MMTLLLMMMLMVMVMMMVIRMMIVVVIVKIGRPRDSLLLLLDDVLQVSPLRFNPQLQLALDLLITAIACVMISVAS
jgi:hypothetical protein